MLQEIESWGAKLDGEIRLRREMEDKLLSQEKQLQSLQELLAVVERERDSLTIELRDSLAAYKELLDRQALLFPALFHLQSVL